MEKGELFHKVIVMDVLPWPNGHGFAGREVWWDYVLNESEGRKLDFLLGTALLDADLQKRLIEQRDYDLLKKFGLSDDTCQWLRSSPATSLAELGREISRRAEYLPLTA